MKRLLPLVMLLAACASVQPGATPRYLSHPAHTIQTSRTEPVAVFIDERTMFWINSFTLNARHLQAEQGACARIAKKVGDAFFVDTLLPPRGDVFFTAWSSHFSCNPDEAPIHWHPHIDELMCEPSQPDSIQQGGDTHPAYAVFPFNLMVCGLGIDSVIAYKVRPALKEAAHGKGK